MSLVLSLLHAIVRLDGEAVVMHVGDRPYVVTPGGHVDLATRSLTLDAVDAIVGQVLTPEAQQAFQEFGATQCELAPLADFPQEQFTIVVARSGDDVWAEIRRHHLAVALAGLEAPWTSAPSAAASPSVHAVPELAFPTAVSTGVSVAVEGVPTHQTVQGEGALLADSAGPLAPSAAVSGPSTAGSAAEEKGAVTVHVTHAPTRPVPPPPPLPVPMFPSTATGSQAPPLVLATPTAAAEDRAPSDTVTLVAGSASPLSSPQPPGWVERGGLAKVAGPEIPLASVSAPSRSPDTVGPQEPPDEAPPDAPREAHAQPAVVLPLSRSPIRPDAPRPIAEDALAGLDRLLRLAAARGASTLYLSSSARPSVRVDGDIQALDGAPMLGPNEVESLLLTLMPERSAEALRTGAASEWICDVPDVGRVRCMSFRDHRGPGGVFRMMPTRSVTVDQLGLSREIQALANEPEGLVLIAGPRASGKRTLMSGLVDFVNRTRRDHVITIESEINIVHERGASFVSQREVRGGSDEMLRVAEVALREDPDVLVLEEVRTAALMDLALDAAASGHLVIAGLPAHTASGAVDRIIDLYQPEARRQVQIQLAQHLRGVVAQVLLRKSGGGRLAAREVLLNTPAVASVLAEGKTSQLPLAIEGGRKHGMVPLNDALVGFVQSGAVDAREAYRHASDRPGLLSLLKRQGIDTSALERLA